MFDVRLFLSKEGLLEIKPNRQKGCQPHLTKNALQDILLLKLL